jgi:hypothetical protein
MTGRIVLIIGLLFPAWSSAQEIRTLNLEKCLRIAFEHNAEIIGAGLDEERSEVDLRTSLGRFLPSFDSRFSVNMQDEARDSYSEIRGGFVNTNKSYRFDLSANYNLFNGFGDRASYRASQRVREARKLTRERTKEEIALLVIQRYLACLRADQFVRIGRDALERSKAQLEKMEAMLQVGTVPKADVMKQKVQFGNDRLSLIQSGIESERARTDLFAVLGIEAIPEAVRLEEVVIEPTDEKITFEEALNTARTHRKDLASLDYLSEGNRPGQDKPPTKPGAAEERPARDRPRNPKCPQRDRCGQGAHRGRTGKSGGHQRGSETGRGELPPRCGYSTGSHHSLGAACAGGGQLRGCTLQLYVGQGAIKKGDGGVDGGKRPDGIILEISPHRKFMEIP